MTDIHSFDAASNPSFLLSEQLPLSPADTLLQSRKLLHVPLLVFAEISPAEVSVRDVALEGSLSIQEKDSISMLFPSLYAACKVIGTTGQTVILQDVAGITNTNISVDMHPSGSVAGVPVINHQNELIGALCCFDTSANVFSREHLKYLQIFASAYHSAYEYYLAETRQYTNAIIALPNFSEIDDHLILALVAAMNAHSQETSDHSARVPAIVEQIASLIGMSSDHLNLVRAAAILHDIGKIGIPSSIIHKNGPLTDEEWNLMRQHPVIGQRILESCGGPLAAISTIVVAHHERWDGKGYPYGLKQEEIPQIARMISIADSFDAMISDRPYRKALPFEKTIDELHRGVGTQFDPEMTELFLDLLDRERTAFGKAA